MRERKEGRWRRGNPVAKRKKIREKTREGDIYQRKNFVSSWKTGRLHRMTGEPGRKEESKKKRIRHG